MLAPGDKLDRYTVEAVLGRGGMGCVYRAHDPRLDRRVALKVVLGGEAAGGSSDENDLAQSRARLLREARAAAALDHPNAVSIFDVGEAGDEAFIAMELVEGRTLRDLGRDGGIPLRRKLGWLVDVARALGAAHDRGIVHRDVKSDNVMVRSDGRVKVLDFGIARRASRAHIDPHGDTAAASLPTLTREGSVLGTPVYMAPEQIRGREIDGRTDQFAWGVLAHEVLEGRLPWQSRDPMALLAEIVSDPPQPLSDAVDARTRAAIQRALEKSPDDRFATMHALVEALEPALDAPASAAPAASAEEASAANTPRTESSPVPLTPGPAGASSGPRTASSSASADLRSYSTGELKAILERALVVQSRAPEGGVRYSHHDLVEAAREVGVDEEALRLATLSLDAPRPSMSSAPPDRFSDLGAADIARGKLARHAATFALCSAFLIAIDLLTPGRTWFHFPVLAWGAVVALHAARVRYPVEKLSRRERKSPRLRREHTRTSLRRSFATWSVMACFFLLLNLFTRGGGGFWAFYPIVGWGLAVALRAVRYRFPADADDIAAAEQLAREAAPAADRVACGVDLLLAASSLRCRVAPAPVRVATPITGELDLPESESELDLELAAPRRRRHLD